MIIGISGGRGAGKSTISRKLIEKLPDSKLIICDNYMHEYSRKLEREIFERLQIKKDPKIFSYNYFFSNFENVNIWVKTIEEYVVAEIEQEIIRNQDKQYIIVDWCFLPLCDFFDKCDLNICINTNIKIREKRLTERLINKDKSEHNRNDTPLNLYTKDMYIKSIEYTDLSNKGFEFDYYINNNFTIEDLNQSVQEVVNQICFVDIL